MSTAAATVSSGVLGERRLEWYKRPGFMRLASVVAVLSAWEIYGNLVPVIFVSKPSAVATAAVKMLTGMDFWAELGATVSAMLIGYLVAILAGSVIGFLMGRYRSVFYVLDPYVTILYATPRIALIPLLIMMFGIDMELRLSIVFLSCVFPVIINTTNGVRAVDPDLVETAVAFNANDRQILRTVILPAALPFVLSGFQIALGHAIIGVIVAEMTVAVSGIGGLIVEYGNAFQTAYMLVPILCTSCISILMVNILRSIERRVMPYRFLGPQKPSMWKRLFGGLSFGGARG